MTEDQKRIHGIKRLAKDLERVDEDVGGLVIDAIRAVEREAWLKGFEFGIEMDKAILEIGKETDHSG